MMFAISPRARILLRERAGAALSAGLSFAVPLALVMAGVLPPWRRQ